MRHPATQGDPERAPGKPNHCEYSMVLAGPDENYSEYSMVFTLPLQKSCEYSKVFTLP